MISLAKKWGVADGIDGHPEKLIVRAKKIKAGPSEGRHFTLQPLCLFVGQVSFGDLPFAFLIRDGKEVFGGMGLRLPTGMVL